MFSGDDPSAEKMRDASPDELAAALRWQWDMGVDLAVGDQPRNYFAEAAAKAAAPAPAPAPAAVEAPEASGAKPARVAPRYAPEPLPVRAASPEGAVSPDEALADARALAASATTLDELKAALGRFEGSALKRTATHLVFAEGLPSAKIMFIGDSPADQDDREGQLFTGAAGALLDRMLASIGLDRAKVHLANAVPWRPPGGKRSPTAHEMPVCLTFLHRYIELARPEVIVTLGDLPSRGLLGAKEPIVRARGKWFELALPDSKSVPAIAMLHPDYLLAAPAAKRHAWADLRALRKALAEKGLA